MTPQLQPGNTGAVNGAPPVFGAPKPKLLGYRAYARHREASGLSGASLAAVQKAIANGRISTVTLDGKKLIDAASADRDWAAHTEARNDNQPNGPAEQRTIPGADEFARTVPSAAPDPVDDGSYAAARAKREHAQARLKELDLAERAGSLVNKSEIGREMVICGRWLKQALDNLPARLSALVAATTDEHEVHRIMKAEIRQIEQELCDRLLGDLEAAA